MSYIVAGCDPGVDGAMVALEVNGARAVVWRVWRAALAFMVPGKGRKQYDPAAMKLALQELRSREREAGLALVVIEAQQGRPGTGMIHTPNNILRSWGLWEGLVVGMGLPSRVVHPTVWRRALVGVPGKGKQQTIRYVQGMLPDLEELAVPKGGRKYHEGVADAAAIALWGVRHVMANHTPHNRSVVITA